MKQDLSNKIILWLKNKVKETGVKGLILGLSGGLDSAVNTALCKKAVGKNLLCLIMPCNSFKDDIIDAKFIAKKLKVKYKVIDLKKIYNEFLKILPKSNEIARANLKPRLRMITLYYFANKLNYLVVGTGNKSEIMIGYFTKYGDGGVDILPIGNLLKTDVRKLAKELNIPERIINKPPSAGLWKGQTDEGELGITYNELDKILLSFEKNKKINLPKDKVKKIKNLIKKSAHKRRTPEIFNF